MPAQYSPCVQAKHVLEPVAMLVAEYVPVPQYVGVVLPIPQ